MLRDDKASAKQRNDSGEKTSRAKRGHCRCDHSQLPRKYSVKGSINSPCQRQPAGSKPINGWNYSGESKWEMDAVTPIVTLWGHQRAKGKCSKKGEKNQCKQRAQNRFSVKDRGDKGFSGRQAIAI